MGSEQLAEIISDQAKGMTLHCTRENVGWLLDLINSQAAEIERLRKAWRKFADAVDIDPEQLNFQHVVIEKAKYQAAEIDRLNTHVQRTADGELPELTVWWPGAVEVHHGFVQRPGVRVIVGRGDIQVDIGACYSTPELAETARLAAQSAVRETKADG